MNTLSARKLRALAQMGVDVWVRRGGRASAAPAIVPVAPGVPDVPVVSGASAAPVAPAAATTRSNIARGPTVALDCLAARGVVIVGEFVQPPDRRIAHDIVMAIAGSAVSPARTAFRWPLTQTGDAGIDAARKSYREFLRGQTERAGARWLLLLGAAATELLDGSTSPDSASTVQTLRLPSASALRADPIAKQRLWLSVSQNDRS
ncbi:MAG TPA: hypothetical protein VIZ30_01605 [Pseudomonadales bacterium]